MSLQLILIFSLLATALSHSYLTAPPPYTKECKGCYICPSERKNPRNIHHTRHTPTVTWSRGQKVNIKWVKNNHNGGFVRLSLLPVSGTFNATALRHFAFYYGCWEQGRYRCRGKECGGDNKGLAFHRLVTIPDNLPDGIYTFAFLWYGGTHFRRTRGLYSDYVSCSYVRIRGGWTLKNEYQPFFEPGELGEYEHKGQCLTSANAPGQCLHGCDFKPTFYDIPSDFKRKTPRALSAWEYGMEMPSGGAAPKPQKDEQEVGMPVIPDGFKPGGNYNKLVDGKKKKEEEKRTKSFICNHKIGICCSGKCGQCEDRRCNRRNGGYKECCPSYIRSKSGRKCSEKAAPCYYNK